MYAIVETGGKQYRAAVGETLQVELLGKQPGEAVEFDRVLLVSDDNGVRVGQPVVEGAKVTGELVANIKGKKIIVFKMKRRKNYRRKTGHRQQYAQVRITAIEG